MKFSRIFAPTGALAVLLIAVMCTVGVTGCSGNQTQAVQKAVGVISQIKDYVDSAQALIPGLQSVDPALAAEVQEYSQLASVNLGNLINIGNAYLQKPSGDQYQVLLNGVDAFAAGIDATTLKAAKISNPNTQQKVLVILGLASTAAHVAVDLLREYATSAQKKAMPAIANRVSFDQIRPYLNPEAARETLAGLGYSQHEIDAAMENAGL